MRKLFSLFVALLATTSLWAYDFQSGELYYTITSSSAPYTVEVTYQEKYSSNNYAGLTTSIIPETVTYNGTTYSVTSIGRDAFYGCSSLTSVTIGNNVTIIGDFAFSFCEHLQSITIPNSVISIGSWAFQQCPLFSITIGNSLEHIGDHAFSGCKFDSIIIPKSVKKINYGVFRYCERLAHIIVEDGNAIYDSRDNCNAIIKTAENTLVAGCKNTIIPNSVTSIGEGAFDDCTSLTSITIPNSVTSIGGHAFSNCHGLTSITIPNSVTSIGDWTFAYCSSLTSITIPNSVTSIGISAFGYCHSLTSITIPNSVKKIEYWAFWFCHSLNSIIIPNSVESIGHAAFYDCRSLKSVTISENLKSIDFSTFAYCSELTTINIPNNVTSIGDYAFLGCSSLDSITIPKNVENIGDSVFLHCDSLEFVKLKTTTPPTLGVSIFSSQLDFYIPCGTLPSYEASDWNNYAVNFESYQLYTMDVSTNDKNMGDVTILENACERPIVISATPHFGYHFTQWSDGNTDNPRTIVLTHDTTLTAEFAPIISGLCGDSLYWKYDQINKTISITGSGNMYDYTIDTQPWILFKEEIKEVHISNMATSIGIAAFQGCTRLSKVNIGTAMKNIASSGYLGLRLPAEVQLQRVNRVIFEELSPCQREILLAYYFQQKTIPQIAQERQVNKSTVCRTLHRAEHRLRQFLKY